MRIAHNCVWMCSKMTQHKFFPCWNLWVRDSTKKKSSGARACWWRRRENHLLCSNLRDSWDDTNTMHPFLSTAANFKKGVYKQLSGGVRVKDNEWGGRRHSCQCGDTSQIHIPVRALFPLSPTFYLPVALRNLMSTVPQQSDPFCVCVCPCVKKSGL